VNVMLSVLSRCPCEAQQSGAGRILQKVAPMHRTVQPLLCHRRPFQTWPGCITNMPGYDFRKGHPCLGPLPGLALPCISASFSLLFFVGSGSSNSWRRNDYQLGTGRALPAFCRNHPAKSPNVSGRVNGGGTGPETATSAHRTLPTSPMSPASSIAVVCTVAISRWTSTDDRFGRETVADGVAAGALLAFFAYRTGAFAAIATVGLDMPKRGH
jgi:hypothetical protein